MLLGLFTVVVMLIVAYAFWRQGVLAAFVMAGNVFLAGLAAFNFFEPIAAELDPLFAGTFLQGYEDSLCMVGLFCSILGLLRWTTNALIRSTVELHPVVQQGGAVLFGLITGYLVAGFLLCAVQTLPFDDHFMKFEAVIDSQSPGARARRIMPPDRVWLALMHRASTTSLAWGEDSPFDPDGSFELRYSRERRYSE